MTAAAAIGVAALCGAIVSSGNFAAIETAWFRSINNWPQWLYQPMWVVQLSAVIGALLVVAVLAAIGRKFRLAAALLAGTFLKILLEDVTKEIVQRDRPGELLPDVILRGNAAAHGLSFPSGHAIVTFAIATLVAPYLKGRWKILPWALAAAVCIARVYLGAHFPLDVLAGAGLGVFIGSMLNLILGVPARSTPPGRVGGPCRADVADAGGRAAPGG